MMDHYYNSLRDGGEETRDGSSRPRSVSSAGRHSEMSPNLDIPIGDFHVTLPQ